MILEDCFMISGQLSFFSFLFGCGKISNLMTYVRLRFTYRITAKMRNTAARTVTTTKSRKVVSMFGAGATVDDADVIVEVEL